MKREIYAFQLLRAVAASLVAIDHSLLAIYRQTLTPEKQHFAWTFGEVGVEAFFLISGCLMMVTSLRQFGQPGAPLRFMKRRLLRIVPLYWITTFIVVVVLAIKGPGIPLPDILRSMFFIPYMMDNGLMRPIVQVGWTLNYEMFFYVVFAAVLLLPPRAGIATLCALFAVLVGLGSLSKPVWDTSEPVTLFQAWTNPIILVFLIGSLLAFVRPWLDTRLPTLSPTLLATIAAVVLVAGCLLAACTDNAFPRTLALQWGLRLCAVAAVIVCLMPSRAPEGAVGKMLYLFGNASYSTYLFHSYAVRYGMGAIQQLPFQNTMLSVVLLVLMSNLLGLALHLAIEKPIIRLFQSEKGLLRIFQAVSRRPALPDEIDKTGGPSLTTPR